jgi:hypothetical protein
MTNDAPKTDIIDGVANMLTIEVESSPVREKMTILISMSSDWLTGDSPVAPTAH